MKKMIFTVALSGLALTAPLSIFAQGGAAGSEPTAATTAPTAATTPPATAAAEPAMAPTAEPKMEMKKEEAPMAKVKCVGMLKEGTAATESEYKHYLKHAKKKKKDVKKADVKASEMDKDACEAEGGMAMGHHGHHGHKK